MCCFFTALFFFGPRLGFLIYWLVPAGGLKVMTTFNTWFWPFLGLVFLPWTTLMYTILFPMMGFDWIWLGIAVLADLASYGGGAYKRRDVPGYRGP